MNFMEIRVFMLLSVFIPIGHEMEFIPTMKMELPDYIALSRNDNNAPNESSSRNMSTTFIQGKNRLIIN